MRLKKTGESLPLEKYLSEEYYYGDYTRMNTWLCEKFHLPEELSADRDPKIEEADFSGIDKVLLDLKEYRNVPAKAVEDLRVFDLKELLEFLRWAARRFYKHLT